MPGIQYRCPHQVGQKKANRWGLFDMYGNVWEWCRDTYSNRLAMGGRRPRGEIREHMAPSRVIRGGYVGSVAEDCRSATRNRELGFPTLRGSGFGFRVTRSAVGQVKVGVPSAIVK